MAKKKKICAPATPAKAQEQETANDLLDGSSAVELPKYKHDSSAFNIPVEDGKDYISRLPSEMLDNVLSYCVLDHEPGLAMRRRKEGANFKPRPHVLLSLAAMSKHFNAHVESFCMREMTKSKDYYGFKSNAELEEGKRRSPRLKDQGVERPRRYRFELVKHLQMRCIDCNCWGYRDAVMANSVKCHRECGSKVFPATIDLTTAMKAYDLRDWMLLKAREPGPRAKVRAEKLNLPTIPYGTTYVPKPYMVGQSLSYRFYVEDVAAIARLVHGDIKKHMAAKREKQSQRKAKDKRKVHRELKLRYHADSGARAADRGDDESAAHHENRLKHYESADWDTKTDADAYDSDEEYGNYWDLHERLCEEKDYCDICHERMMVRYCPWW